jgi:UDP-2-acetamido-3-amino-2,3-dideoxy-glucuronate N-acetyltransferase
MNSKDIKMQEYDKIAVQSKKIGANTQIWQFTVVLPDAEIGSNCNINSHCFVENDVIIGNNVTIKCGVYVWDGIILEDNVFVGPNVTFINDKYPRSKGKFKLLRTTVKRNASIGANSTILPGITIGEYAMIGAGSVVTKDIPNNTLWLGNPARQIGFICNCGNRLDKNLHCNNCNSDYRLKDNKIVIND